ncbi:EAL domain-containing protein (putative c-di-GMP-specific phosphodiesterase class I)/GGDEF domain-containing protein [Nakamurella sp. UYEF19]|uniref:putative bifunctional diguanylate cyclase/phosphodiesterase n=1 Tax=Nakamurella sp. UYEF19 TaxID=1756392 RepID=UPI0033979D4B
MGAGVGWALCLHVGAAGSMATVGCFNLQWWGRDRSQRFLAATGLLCWSVTLTLVVGAIGLSFPEADVFRVVVPVRAMVIGITAALFLATLGTLVPLPALRAGVVAELLLPVVYSVFGFTGDAAYTFVDGSPWPMIQSFGDALAGSCALIFLAYAVLAWWRLTGARRRELAAATISVLAILAIAAFAGPGWLMEAMTSLWTLPIAILLAWWCSTRVVTLQGSLVSASEGRLRAEHVAHHLARYDQLTGLSNLDGALEELQSLLGDPQTPVLVAQFHVSRLEQVRAATGSAAADSVLRTIAAHLMTVLPSHARVARVREATFMISVPVPVPPPDADLEEYAEQAVTLLQRTTDLPRNLVVSVGITVSHPTSTAAELVQEVGTALVAAQQARGRVRVYRTELRQELLARARLTRLLTVATERDEFELHYQPIVDTTTLARVGVEALVRWRHHGRLHPPAEWIPIAEQEGLMPAIGLRVLRLAARDVPAIGCPIAVNVSARQLVDPEFVGNVLDTLRDLPRHALILEITESSVMADLEQARTALMVFRDHGIRIAIDDFGTEYSSLSRLATVPFDILKIDRSFVTAVTSPHGRSIVTAIHALARALGKTTVAEGVETREELRALTEIGCDRVQGFLTGRPIPLADLLAARGSGTAVSKTRSGSGPPAEANLVFDET